jgi:hypothetical protein
MRHRAPPWIVVGIRSAVPISERDKTVTDLRLGMNSASSFHM